MELNEAIARKVLTTVDAGLVRGVGNPVPGQMCVEAAVCFAYGLPHSDNPPCVGSAVRYFKIHLNDARWSSNEARTAGMRALAIAQLGSDVVDQAKFTAAVVEGTIRRVLPITLRAAAERFTDGVHGPALRAAAETCEREGSRQSVLAARKVACAAVAARDKVLGISADVALQALIQLQSPGCAYLYLLDARV